MFIITIHFQPTFAPLDGRHVTGRGLYGLLFEALKQADPTETDWLHEHPAPKPFSLAPLYAEGGMLVGLRIGTVSARVARLVVRAWEWYRQEGRPQSIGHQQFSVGNVVCAERPDWAELAAARPVTWMEMEFLSTTTFRQGPGHMPLPVPANVFAWPWRMWQACGPGTPLEDWLEWCRREVFVVKVDIETVPITLSREIRLTGFVGQARFCASRGAPEYLGRWHALAQLATVTGVGWKTTMGMGAIDLIGTNA